MSATPASDREAVLLEQHGQPLGRPVLEQARLGVSQISRLTSANSSSAASSERIACSLALWRRSVSTVATSHSCRSRGSGARSARPRPSPRRRRPMPRPRRCASSRIRISSSTSASVVVSGGATAAEPVRGAQQQAALSGRGLHASAEGDLSTKRSLVAASLTNSSPSMQPLAAHVADGRVLAPSQLVQPRSGSTPRCAAPFSSTPPSTSSRDRGQAGRAGERVAAEGVPGVELHQRLRARPRTARRRAARSRAPRAARSRRSSPCRSRSMSGSTPECSVQNSLPVRPKPVMISSKISSTSCRSAISRSAAGSRPAARRSRPTSSAARSMIAATVSGPSCTIVSSTSRA